MRPMFHFEIKKDLLQGNGTWVGTGTVPPLFELVLVAGNQSMQVFIQNFTTLQAAKDAVTALLAVGVTVTWTDSTYWSTSSTVAQPASA